MKTTYTEEAIVDIVEAITYLHERNPTAAANLDAEIARCIERLAAQEFEGPLSRLRSGALVAPTRLFLMHARMFGLPVEVFNRRSGGHGAMQVKIAGAIPMVDARGEVMDRSAAVTGSNSQQPDRNNAVSPKLRTERRG